MTNIQRKKVARNKYVSAREALSKIKNGQSVYVGSGAGEPVLLTQTLASMATEFWDVEVVHLATTAHAFVLAKPELRNHFRYNTFCVGRGIAGTVSDGSSDHTPMEIGDFPVAIRRGDINVDVALVQVTPPNSYGQCSLGLSVDASRAAIETADLVIAQINPKMPVTFGDSWISMEELDFLVNGETDLLEVPPIEVDAVSLSIGKHVASLIKDGVTLYFSRGPVSASTMRYLGNRRHLGIHTVFLTDDIMRLIKTRAVTNRKKASFKDKTVATIVVGSGQLYEEVNKNPYIELLPLDQLTDPHVVGQDDNFVSVHDVQEVRLTGVALVFSEEAYKIGGMPVGRGIVQGSRRSANGFSIMALRSTTSDGACSRIVATSSANGASYSRTTVDFVVTEYGIAALRGKSARERALALIFIAHPKFRHGLLKEAKALGLINQSQLLPPESGCVYPQHFEFTHTFDDGLEILFRPVKPSDARYFQNLFYSLSPEMVRMRYHGTIKTLSNETAQQMAVVNYCQDVALIGLVGGPCKKLVVAEARYMFDPTLNMGEFSVVVHEKYQGRGIGKFLAEYIKKIAFTRGLAGVYAEVVQRNEAVLAVLRKAWPTATSHYKDGYPTIKLTFPKKEFENLKDSVFVYSGRYGDFSYGENHPFLPKRAVSALQIMEEQGYLDEPWMRVEEPKSISIEDLVATHAPGFVDALNNANDGLWKDEYVNYGLGKEDCPIFKGLFEYVMLYTSATVTGARFILEENANIVFNPLGGFHHSSSGHAEGFCYVNDVIVAINMFLAAGMTVAYIDIDAHHGNGVQDAYYEDDRVLFVSTHQTGETLYPWSGFETEIGRNIGRGYTINVPLPVGADDASLSMVFEQLISPAVRQFSPSVVVAAVGADTHRQDPLAQLSFTNNGMLDAVKQICSYSKHTLLLGAGGYDIDVTAAAWARMWAGANRIDDLPDYLLTVGGSFMGSSGMGAEIVDLPYRVSGELKDRMTKELERIIVYHNKNTLPFIR